MAITVTQRPSTTISGETSRWNAVNNPVVYKMTTDEYAQPNYRLEVDVYDGSNNLLTDDAFVFTPDSAGALTVNISSILKAQLLPDFDGDLTGSTNTFDDSNVYIKFYIKYQEFWDGSSTSETNDSANQFFAVLSANQIPAPYGGNMAEYVTFDDGTPAASFLTKLDNIKMWRGYPCLVSIIAGDSLTTNQAFILDDDNGTIAGYAGKILTVDINQILSDQTVDSNNLTFYSEGLAHLLSETKPIILEDACDNPILLVGRNKLGGLLTWMFDVDQEYTFDYGNDIKAARKVLKASNLTINEWDALQDFISLGDVYRNNITELTSTTIKTSSRIGNQVYVVDIDGNKTGVVVIPSNNATNTRRIKHFFELEIEYPEEL